MNTTKIVSIIRSIIAFLASVPNRARNWYTSNAPLLAGISRWCSRRVLAVRRFFFLGLLVHVVAAIDPSFASRYPVIYSFLTGWVFLVENLLIALVRFFVLFFTGHPILAWNAGFSIVLQLLNTFLAWVTSL